MYIFTFCSIHHGVGSFRFKSKTQCFTIQQCSQTFSIKVYISVDKSKLSKDEAPEIASSCRQLRHHLQECIKEVRLTHIPCGREPIGYLQCPLNHEGNQAPHIRLDDIDTDAKLLCSKSGEVVPLQKYDLISQNYGKQLHNIVL